FMHRFGAGHVALGNQKDMDFGFINKDGYSTLPSFDQSSAWTRQQDMMVRSMTGGKGRVVSVIEPLTNLAITKILHTRYPDLASYQVSCDCLDASDEKRWCHDCNKCARLFLFMKAFGIDPKRAGFSRNLMQKRYRRLYSIFSEVDAYEKSAEARDQQLLAFLLAYRNGERGGLIELFRRSFLDEAKEREDQLMRRFLSVYPAENMPKKMFREVKSIYEEELET
ncbi:MAG: hypothetical protein R6U32_06995, partial [Candidatus Woesearchaeota archaeon]